MKKSDKLLKFILDDGTGTDRQILSGIHKWYQPEDLVGKTLIAIVNLPPRKMMGLESNGMLISAVHKEHGEEAAPAHHGGRLHPRGLQALLNKPAEMPQHEMHQSADWCILRCTGRKILIS